MSVNITKTATKCGYLGLGGKKMTNEEAQTALKTSPSVPGIHMTQIDHRQPSRSSCDSPRIGERGRLFGEEIMKDQQTDTSANGFLSGFLIGGLMGAMVALWFAPQSGKRTQHMIRKQAHRLQRTAEGTLENVKDGAQHVSEDVKEMVSDAQHDSQEWLEHQANQVNKTTAKIRNTVTQ